MIIIAQGARGVVKTFHKKISDPVFQSGSFPICKIRDCIFSKMRPMQKGSFIEIHKIGDSPRQASSPKLENDLEFSYRNRFKTMINLLSERKTGTVPATWLKSILLRGKETPYISNDISCSTSWTVPFFRGSNASNFLQNND